MRVHLEDEQATHLLKEQFKEMFESQGEIVFLCIGTDRSTGDAFGPFVGLELKKMKKLWKRESVHVYGCLHDPVHALNFHGILNDIQTMHPDALLVAVDSCLCSIGSLETICVENKPLKPGAFNAELPETGDWRILGNVNVSGYMEHMVLGSTRLSLVLRMAEKTAQAISLALFQLDQEKQEATVST
ncbi:spore protease YyaC [Planococcus lenghuensis]|uniref:Spore protease YyaC n=1 Tax=Planococcus lenghuensis TaxID=2213202 RepID=A0A1Q2KV35_9BACL|nr:spore protease YyaC [Planococcus lenghuensis]AQQ52049.1 spore protease YyaC [Planococcus lenghuensis]